MTYSAYAEECFAALDWGISLPAWFELDRVVRATMVATVRAKALIANHAEED